MVFGRHTSQPLPHGDEGQVAINQERAHPLTRVRLLPGVVRYMYDRSDDSKANREPGQDFLAFRYANGRLAFAVCDGVGGSFLGNLAAQFLGECLVKWLWEQPSPVTTDRLQRDLSRYLHELVGPANHFVESYPLPNDRPPIVHEVLEEQRAYGSEAMFACGRVEWPSQRSPGQVALAWLGDAELQIYDKSGRRCALLRGTVAERWSTSQGARGELQTLVEAADGIARVIGYSDGLRSLVDDLHRLPDNVLARELVRLGQHSHSDDLTLVDIALDEQYMPAERGVEDYGQSPEMSRTQLEDRMAYSPPTAIGPSPDPSLASPHVLPAGMDGTGSVLLRWTPVHGAEEYRVQLAATSDAFERVPLEYVLRETTFRTAPLTGRIQYARVQALAGKRCGPWSKLVPLGDTRAARPSEPVSPRPIRPTPPYEHPTPGEPGAWQDRPPTMRRPMFLSPPYNAIISTSFELTWTEVLGAERYLVQEATDLAFDPDDTVDYYTYEPYFMVKPDEPGAYYYRVRAQTPNARSAWSRPLRLQVKSNDLIVSGDSMDSS